MVKILFITLFLTIECFAQRTGWWIFRRPQSTKPRAITAVTAVRGDLSGILYNPSILGTITKSEIFFMTEITGFAGDTFGGIFYAQPLGKISGISAGMIYYDAGRTTIYWIEGGVERKREKISLQRDLLGLISFGKRLSKKILTGLTLKIANSTIAERESAIAFATDLGVMVIPFNDLNVSLAIQNLGFSDKFVEKAEPLPTSAWFGSSYRLKIADSYLTFGFDIPYIFTERTVLPSVGLEYTIGKFGINTAYRFNVREAVLHLGFTINLKKIDIGYSFTPAQYLAHTHRLNLGYKW